MLRTLTFVVCLFISSSAFAQQTTMLTQLAQTFREGTTVTSSVDLPANLATTQQAIAISLDIPDNVYENVSTRLHVRIYRLDLGSGEWRMIGASTFTGGRIVDEDGEVNPPSVMSFAASELAGQTVRAEVETISRVRLGATVFAVSRTP